MFYLFWPGLGRVVVCSGDLCPLFPIYAARAVTSGLHELAPAKQNYMILT
jgi:hypothetical protein